MSLPFLKKYKDEDKASIRLRLATPFAGDKYGFHFPLYKGTEVLLSFRHGDPDLPVIVAAVFNSTHENVINIENAYLGGKIKTKAGNVITFVEEDKNSRSAIKYKAAKGSWHYI